MEKFIYNDEILTLEVTDCETSPYYEVSIFNDQKVRVFTGMYDVENADLAIEVAKAAYGQVRSYRTVHDTLAEFEKNNRFCCFSEDELITLSWAFSHRGIEAAYPVLANSFEKEMALYERVMHV